MKLHIDSNIILDALLLRGETFKSAQLLLALGRIGEFELWVSPSQWSDLYYILSEGGKRSRADSARTILKELRSCLRISVMGESEIDQAMSYDWDDLEDALVYVAAKSVNADAIITQNIQDFTKAKCAIFTCQEFFDWFRDTHGFCYEEVAW